MPLFEARNINKSYRDTKALDDVSIMVPEKSVFGLLGPNGAGKTTLIRIINQITGPDNGELYFGDEKLQPHHIEKIGYLPEERGLYKKMKVGEQALYLARLKGMSKRTAMERLKEWFVKFEMTGWWNKKIEELSKGMQQKVQFITTVLHEPELLILDEPFSGFDPINTRLIKKEIMELREKGTTIIFSTHDMPSVEEMCDSIALINKGRKILDGPVREIRQKYKANTYTVEFKGSMIGFTNALWGGAELVSREEKDGVNKVVVKLLHNNKSSDLIRAVIPHVELVSFNEYLPSLNDIFITEVSSKHEDKVNQTGEI